MTSKARDSAQASAKSYYDSKAESFFDIWGGEHIHYGLYSDAKETLAVACMKTIDMMYGMLNAPGPGARVIDLGSGFGGASRYLAAKGHAVTCVDQSAANNRINKQLNEARNVAGITIVEESFESMSFPDSAFDIAWSQEAICHTADLHQVFADVYRILKPEGEFVLGNTCVGERAPADVHANMNRRNAVSLQTIDYHSEMARSVGFEESTCLDLSEHLVPHYQQMLREVAGKKDGIIERDGEKFFDRAVEGLEYWVRACERGQIAWAVWRFSK